MYKVWHVTSRSQQVLQITFMLKPSQLQWESCCCELVTRQATCADTLKHCGIMLFCVYNCASHNTLWMFPTQDSGCRRGWAATVTLKCTHNSLHRPWPYRTNKREMKVYVPVNLPVLTRQYKRTNRTPQTNNDSVLYFTPRLTNNKHPTLVNKEKQIKKKRSNRKNMMPRKRQRRKFSRP